jgi:hypothetical protein
MADVESNILEFEAEFKDLIDGFVFTLPGKDQSLGRDLAASAAMGISDRSIATQADAQGQPWRENEDKYRKMKERKHGVYNVGVLTGQMLSLESMKGETTVEPDEVLMVYGTGEPPTRFSTYGELRDDEPDDRQKAAWFADSGREFFELNDDDAARIYGEVAEALVDYLEKA